VPSPLTTPSKRRAEPALVPLSVGSESPRSKRRLFDDEDEDPVPNSQQSKSQNSFGSLPPSVLTRTRSPCSKTVKSSFVVVSRQLHHRPGVRRGPRQPVFKVPYPKQALPRDPELVELSTTFLGRKDITSSVLLGVPSTLAEEIQVVPSKSEETSTATPQQVPHGQEPSSRKPRAGFKSPVFSFPSLPSPAVTPVKSPEVVGSSPGKQQQQQLFSVAIRPVTRKGSKYTDAGELFPSNICYQFQNASSTPLLTPESAGDDAKQMVADSREHRQGCQPPPVSFPHTLCGPG